MGYDMLRDKGRRYRRFHMNSMSNNGLGFQGSIELRLNILKFVQGIGA